MSDEQPQFKRDAMIDFAGAIVLGVTTALAAFGAYESSLWGGNQATAYTQATNTLGDANRELLRGVQERSFDTTIWIEQLKADAPPPAAPVASGAAPAAAPPEEAEEDEKPQTKEEAAAELADSFSDVEDLPLTKKLDKLLTTRRELVAALKWADAEHDKQTKKMPKDKRLEIARQVVELNEKQEKVTEEQAAILVKLGLEDADDEDVEAALAKNADAKAQSEKLEAQYEALGKEADKILEKLAKPMFFESPAYDKSQTREYEKLLAKGNKLFEDGQKFNEYGDKFTLATVFYTVALFFAGLSAVLKRFPIKATFLTMGSLIAIGATIYLFLTPMA